MKKVYNPFLPPDEYIPDGEPHVFGDRVYLFGSHDREGGESYCELDYMGYSAPVKDLSDWRCEGVIYSAEQDPTVGGDAQMYAPDVVRGNDGRYYLYYHISGSGVVNEEHRPLSVAVCDTPAGRYEYYGIVQNPDGTPFRRFITGDPAVLNDDGVIRLYYGWSLSSRGAAANGREATDTSKIPPEVFKEQLIQAQMMVTRKSREEIVNEEGSSVMGAIVVTLQDDMLTTASEPVRIIPGEFAATGTSFEGHAFYEASSIRKVNDLYYFIYSSQLSHELCYATSKYPDRDFVYRGTIISNGDVGYQGRPEEERLNMTANNHGGIEYINGQWYIFYHRQTHRSTFSRQACAEKITIMADGSIPQVEMTSCGLNNGPLPAVGTYPAVIACHLTNGKMPHITNRKIEDDIPFITHGDDERYITNIKEGTRIGFKYFQFDEPGTLTVVTRGIGSGWFEIHNEDGEVNDIAISPSKIWSESTTTINIKGTSALYFEYHGTGQVEFLSLIFRA